MKNKPKLTLNSKLQRGNQTRLAISKLPEAE